MVQIGQYSNGARYVLIYYIFLSMGKKFGHVYRACRTIRGLGIMAMLYESLERGVRYPGSVSNCGLTIANVKSMVLKIVDWFAN